MAPDGNSDIRERMKSTDDGEMSKFNHQEECAAFQMVKEDARRQIEAPKYEKTSSHSKDYFSDLSLAKVISKLLNYMYLQEILVFAK